MAAADDSRDGARQQLDPPASHIGGDDRPAVVHCRGHLDGLAPRRGARIEDALACRHVDERADELRRLVLDRQIARHVRSASTADCRCARSSRRARRTLRRSAHQAARDRWANAVRVVFSVFARIVREGDALSNSAHAVPPRSRIGRATGCQPTRMRQGDRQILERARPVDWRRRWRRERKASAFAGDAAEECVDESRGAGLTCLSRQLHRIIDNRCRRDSVEVQQLEGAHAEDREHFRVEPFDRPAGEGGNHVVENGLPAQRAGGDFAGERAIAIVLRALYGPEPVRRRDRPLLPQRRAASCTRPGGPAQSLVEPVASARRWPARNSRAVIVRRPSGCISRMPRRTDPSPAAAVRSSPCARTIVPGSASTRSGSTDGLRRMT